MRLLEKTAFPLEKGAVNEFAVSTRQWWLELHEGESRDGGRGGERGGERSLHRAVSVILDGFDLNLSPPHFEVGRDCGAGKRESKKERGGNPGTSD